ncbi:hypothetical protein EVAR_92613_1 [Eumeta japonica]|uniref:Uncharacterized protein n=1 Tax=Eumeta variegata TaxID=151549 RepID=A0A4C1SWM3_EUMVA|nr:hypothetical protein EVAR_92613_1 [Eumeta japonica]
MALVNQPPPGPSPALGPHLRVPRRPGIGFINPSTKTTLQRARSLRVSIPIFSVRVETALHCLNFVVRWRRDVRHQLP